MYSLSTTVHRNWPKISFLFWLLLLSAVLIGILWKVPIWQTNAYRTGFEIKGLQPVEQLQREQNIVTAENNARVTLAQIFGGGFLLLGLYFTWRNLRATEEGKLTDRFGKAVELLGSTNLSVRLGGIYALERIARDSKKDHWTVMEVLTGFVRENSRRRFDLEARGPDTVFIPASIHTDVQAVLGVIGRRKWIEQEHRPPLGQAIKVGEGLDLSNTNLRNASFSGNFAFANLSHADLTGANFRDADLSYAYLDYAQLSAAHLLNAKLYCTRFISADLTNAEIAHARLFATDLNGASLLGSDMTVEQISLAAVNDSTKLPTPLRSHWENTEQQKAKMAKRTRVLDPS